MGLCAIFKNQGGRVAVVYPTPEALALLGIAEIARRDVPAGKPFKIIEADQLPQDREQRDAWTIDDAELTDGVGEGAA